MKHVKLFATICIAAAILLFSSCNSGGDKTDTTTDTTTATTDTSMTTTMPTAPSGPMSVMSIRAKVADYAKWKPQYESNDSVRLANGLHKYVIGRGVEDSNMILVAMIMDDVDKAKAMAASPELKARMKKSGVIGTPSFDYVTLVMNDTADLHETARLLVKHKVKDWDAWKKVFDEHKQARMDAGLTDRVLGYTVGDNHSISIVFAVTDMDKAKAFINSQDLKDKMKEAGVEGKPDFFFYRITERY